MEYTARLRAEIARLRDLLEENGIDPEPYVEPSPQFGPPTRFEYIMHQQMMRLANQMARDLYEEPKSILQVAPDGSTLRIRLPTDFTVRS